jgi:chromosome segregation protein
LNLTLQAAREQLTAADSRLKSLRELEAQFVGYGQGVRTILSAPGFTGRFAQVLADVVETDPCWEQAVEVLLADRVQYLLSPEGRGPALDAISYLKAQAAGRCGFLVSTPRVSPHEPPAGCVCLADLVTVQLPFAPLVRPLLASTYVAEDLQTAMELSQNYPGASFVTRDGDLVAADGSLSAGFSAGAGDGLIHKKREIRQLDSQVEVLSREVEGLQLSQEECQAELTAHAGAVSLGEQELHHIDLQVLTQEKDLVRFREECSRLEDLLKLREMEDRQLSAEQEEFFRQGESVQEQEAASLLTRMQLEQSLSDRVAGLEALRRALGEAREALTAHKVNLAALAEKRESCLQGMGRLEVQLADLDRRETLSRNDVASAIAARSLLETSLVTGQEALTEKGERLRALELQVQELKAEWEEVAGKVRLQEASLRQLRSEHELLHRQADEGKLRRSELQLRWDHVSDMLHERHRTTPDEAVAAARQPDLSTAGAEPRLAALRRQLDELGEVNLAALEDYRQLEERHVFLVGQKADLEESLHELQKAIGKINRTTRQRFHETFTLVNERFRELFPRLFCGGTAELRLTNEDDLLETGIDIIVQPPGKKLQNVSLLSGGEKALTAVALIFSIFQIKPSPFCLLDEVDAPLDEANIGRFNDLVREMSRFSQFIMITHSKATMAVADTLYGITMEEAGVSKVVSVCLNGGSGG